MRFPSLSLRSEGRAVRSAAKAFQAQRFQYYESLADRLAEVSGGNGMNYLVMFEKDAERYVGMPRGILSQHWAERIQGHGGRLSAAWEGTFPEEEIGFLAVAEDHGTQSTIDQLRDLARLGDLIETSKRTFFLTIAVAIAAILIAIGMLLAIPYGFAPMFKTMFPGVTPDMHGAVTRRYFAIAAAIERWWLPVLVAAAAGIAWLRWALPNWVGRGRAWADERIGVFQIYRDFKGAVFLATLSSLTRSRDGAITNQRDALTLLLSHAQPWLGWKIEQMVDVIDRDGPTDASALNVGIVDQETYFLIEDIYEAHGMSAGVAKAGSKTEERARKTIARRGTVIRTGLLAVSVVVVIAIVFWNQAVVWDLKRAVSVSSVG